MIDTATAKPSFWRSKVGHAAIASIAAMSLMVLMSSQIRPGAANAAPLVHPAADSGDLSGIA